MKIKLRAIPAITFVALFACTASAVDSDGDGMSDAFETLHGYITTNPDQNANLVYDGQDDFDGDGLGNAAEELAGTNPTIQDTDGDDLLDSEELGQGEFSAPILVSNFAPTEDVSSVVAADLNGDGYLDLLAASPDANSLRWFAGNGAGGFGSAQQITNTAAGVYDVQVADLDSDSDNDVLIAVQGSGSFLWFENDGTGGFGAGSPIALFPGALAIGAADLDLDGDLDIFGASSSDTIAWFANDLIPGGAVNFGAANPLTSTADFPFDIEAADLDGDNDVDMVVASAFTDSVLWYVNDGAGNFGAEATITTTADFASSVHTSDIDGDGDVDVLATSRSDGRVSLYLNNGAGGFTGVADLTSSLPGANDVFAGDLDGDGDIDAVSVGLLDDQLFAHFNQGGATFSAAQPVLNQADGPVSVIIADLDGDGDNDIATGSFNDSEVTWHNNISFSNPLLADSDGDGFGDGDEKIAGTNALDAADFPYDVPVLPLAGILALGMLLYSAASRRKNHRFHS